MGKKGGKKSKGPSEEELAVGEVFWEIYEKAKKELNEENKDCQDMVEILAAQDELGEPLPCWNFTHPIDEMHFRCIFRNLKAARHPEWEELNHTEKDFGHNLITGIRLWNCPPEDGMGSSDPIVKEICEYLKIERFKITDARGPQELHITGFDMTEKGCSHLAQALKVGQNRTLQFLVLDYNEFGSAGLAQLAGGIEQSPYLRQLSLQQCQIGPECGQLLMPTLLFKDSALEELDLSFNQLGNSGATDLLRACKRAKKLKTLSLRDNGLNDGSVDVDQVRSFGFLTEALKVCVKENTTLANYTWTGNLLEYESMTKWVVEILVGMGHVKKWHLPERVDGDAPPGTMATAVSGATAPPKKGKGKKGKKGKK